MERKKAKVIPSFDEIREMFAETDRKFSQTDKRFIETDKRFIETEKFLKELGKQIGGLGNSFGKYTEGLFGPSIRNILTKNFGAEYVICSFKRKYNGEEIEIDYIGGANGNVNKAVVVEIKTTLKDSHIQQLSRTVSLLPSLMPEQKGKKIYGALAAVSYSEEQRNAVLDNGFYFIKITDDLAYLDVPKNFKPKAF